MDKQSPSEISKFFKSVAYIYSEKVKTETIDGKAYEIWLMDKDSTYIPYTYSITGTSFFTLKEFDIYLITAEHIAVKSNLETRIVVSKQDGTPKVLKLKTIIKDTTKLDWIVHPMADVAVIQLNDNIFNDSLLNIVFLPYELITQNLEAPIRERDVTIYGYPLNLGIGSTNFSYYKNIKAS